MKKSQTTSGQSAKFIKKWKYEDEMSFLRPHIKERDTISSVNIPSDAENETNNDETEIFDEEEGDNDVDINSTITDLKDNQNSITNTESQKNSLEDKIRRKNLFFGQKELNKTNMHKRKQPTESASATLMEYIIKTKEKNNKTETEQDGLDHFFLSIASTVRNFTPYNQHLAKNQIFSIVSDLELKELKTQEQPYKSGNKPSSAYILPQSTEFRQPYINSVAHGITNPTFQNIQYDSTATSSSSCGSYLQTFSPEDYQI